MFIGNMVKWFLELVFFLTFLEKGDVIGVVGAFFW